jgi:hypothetical protein
VLVHVSAKRLGIPEGCACCGGRSDTHYRASHTRTKGKRVVRTESHWFDFPYCSSCLKHVRSYDLAVTLGIFAFVINALGALNVFFTCKVGKLTGLLADLQSLFRYAFVIGFPLAVGAFLVGRRAYRERGESCCATGAAVVYLGWQGTVQHFIFKSPDYCGRFVSLNRAKIVNAHLTQTAGSFDDRAANSDQFFDGFDAR